MREGEEGRRGGKETATERYVHIRRQTERDGDRRLEERQKRRQSEYNKCQCADKTEYNI